VPGEILLNIINRYLDILLILLCTFILVLLILLFPIDILRIIIGLPFVLLFPGYMLTAALYTGKNSIGDIERIALSFGLSFAVVPILGLILNYTPWGISLNTILISQIGFIATMTIIAVIRRSSLPNDERFTFRLDFTFVKDLFSNAQCDSSSVAVVTVQAGTPLPKIKWLDRALSVILIVVVATAIGAFVYTIATPGVGQKFTEFYILGMDGKAQNYPEQIKAGDGVKVLVGIVNHEQEVTSYQLVVSTDNVTNIDLPSISLGKEDKWEHLVEFKPVKIGTDQKVEFQLYKAGTGSPYLSLCLWINVVE
jgi:uncharacterized membrane protein